MSTESSCGSYLCDDGDNDNGSGNETSPANYNNYYEDDRYDYLVALAFFLAFAILPNLVVYFTFLYRQ